MTSIFTDEYYEMALLISQVSQSLYQARYQELKKYGLTPRKAALLNMVSMIGKKATPAEIARWVYRKPHSITELINRMEKEGLVTRVKDLERRNLTRIEMTEKGRNLHHLSLNRKVITRIMSSLTKEERKQLRLLLQIIRSSALEEIGFKGKPTFPASE